MLLVLALLGHLQVRLCSCKWQFSLMQYFVVAVTCFLACVFSVFAYAEQYFLGLCVGRYVWTLLCSYFVFLSNCCEIVVTTK